MRSIILTLIILGLIVFIHGSLLSQTITLNSTFISDDEIFPFGSTGTVYGLRINGDVELPSDSSFVRVVLVDNLFNEYLVYEASPYIWTDSVSTVTNVCDETCYSEGFIPYSLIIQIKDCEFDLNTIVLEPNFTVDATELQQQVKLQKELEKVNHIQARIEEYNMLWFADTNSISNLSYAKKKSLFGDNYNTLGIDYYVGGIYDPFPNSTKQVVYSDLISEWDWRNRHGADDETKSAFYYSGNANGKQGWMTQVKNQREWDCRGLCYIYAPLGALEAVANIYYNDNPHKDYDLSVQHVLDCDNYDGIMYNGKWIDQCVGGHTDVTSDFVKNNQEGVYQEENCYNRQNQPNAQCMESSFQTLTQYKFDYFSKTRMTPYEAPDINEIKTNLIKHGPMCATALNYVQNGNAHAMVLVGYGRIELDDIYHLESGQTITVEENNENIGRVYWIYKNSYGTSSGDGGYLYHIDTDDQPTYLIFYKPPFYDKKLSTQADSKIEDKDNDGYYNWGVDDSFQPTGKIKDSDDSNPRLGPFDENYYSVPVAPVMSVIENSNFIPDNSYYTFYDPSMIAGDEITMTFTIENTGNAQLNLASNALIPIVQLTNETDFTRQNDVGQIQVPMETGSTTFKIKFTLNQPINEAKSTLVTVRTNEIDMDDYTFTLVFADCDQTASTEYINAGTTVNWNGNDMKFGDVVVKAGGILNITGEYAFSQNANLFIEAGYENGGLKNNGGIVIIDGGRLTALCSTWPGIDVWGDKTKTQVYDLEDPLNTPLYQGFIKVINGGEICNATAAIETIKYVNNEPDLTTSGGIVYFNQGKITNCQQSVVFYPYKNFYPTVNDPQLNWSVFYKSNFLNTYTAPENQIYLNGVDGINIVGCNFENQSQYLNQPFFKLKGIESLNSGFTVSDYDYPYPSEETIKSTFRGFNYGIYAKTDGLPASQNYTFINSSVFEDNGRGIYMSTIEYPKIINNEFIVRNKFSIFDENYPEQKMVGLYLDQLTTGFIIEQNNFYSNVYYEKLEDRECFGIVVKNSGEDHNELYNNTFNTLLAGIEAIGTNRDDISDEGLCIKCNDFSRILTDVFVKPTTSPAGNKQGIAKQQGYEAPEPSGNEEPDQTCSAGNVFSSETDLTVSNYTNEEDTCYAIDYWYHGIAGDFKVRPEPTDPLQPTDHIKLFKDENVQYESKETACPSNFGGGGTDVIAAKQSLTDESENVVAYGDTLDMMVDGGNTTGLNLDVVTSTPPQSMSLRQQLLNESPYLSDTVMSSAIDKENVLSNAMLRDVLVANPQSAKSPDLIGSISNRNVQMPGYMMDEIMQGTSIEGGKDILINKLSVHSTARDKAMKQLMAYYISDTSNISDSRDSIISILQNSQYIKPHYRLVGLYLANNDSLAAYTELNNIDVEFDLTDIEEDEHELFTDLAQIQWELLTNPVPQDSSFISELFNIAANYKTTPGIYAQNMLISMGFIEYNEPVYTPLSLKIAPIFSYNTYDNAMDSFLKIFPNPAKDYFTAETKITCDFTEGIIRISTLENKIVDDISFDRKRNQIIIPISNYTSGTYLVQLIIDGEIITTKKLIITN